MKGMKKLLSILMVLTLVLSLGASALAVDINITDANSAGSQYGAYRLLDLTTTAEATEDSTGYSYTVNPTYRDVLKEVTKKTEDKDIIEYISELDTDGIRTFADAVYAKIKSMTPDLNWQTEKTFSGVDQGYYLIAEKVADGTENGVTSLVMLDTAGNQNVSVTTKEDKPKSEKKVLDNNDSENVAPVQPVAGNTNVSWEDSADHDLGDTVYFKLTGTLPSDLDRYDTYELTFHDTEGAGLQFQEGSVKVYMDGNEISDGFTVTTETGDGCTFHVSFSNVKNIPGAAAGKEIVVIYGSKLEGENVVYGNPGNPNEMYMEYTNDSYDKGTGTTPKDKVVVFTYDLDVNKVDGKGEPLNGAEFKLYKEVKDSTVDGAVQLTEDGDVVEGDAVPKDSDKYYVEVTLTATKGTAGTIFTGTGVDDGNYVIVETVTPAGYNAIEPKYFTISATHTQGDAPVLMEVTGNDLFTFQLTRDKDADKAMGQANIQNLTGTELPETGGIGTTIFYIAGAILVAGAVIILVTKKRVSGAEK